MEKSAELSSGIRFFDKPKGITSFDLIRRLRVKLGIRKMGHAGTLDPNATGLMIIAIGSATKELSNLLKLPKTYEAEILFGIQTDTGDTVGKIIEEKDASYLKEKDLIDALKKIEGKHSLLVPRYSAIKVGGKPLYARARSGEVFTPPEKEMEIQKADLLSFEKKEKQVIARVLFDVGSGTYIRSLAEEIGKKLNLPATLQNLRRTKIGKFSIEDAEKIV